MTNELMNWLIDLLAAPASSAAASIMVLLSITYLLIAVRRWMKGAR